MGFGQSAARDSAPLVRSEFHGCRIDINISSSYSYSCATAYHVRIMYCYFTITNLNPLGRKIWSQPVPSLIQINARCPSEYVDRCVTLRLAVGGPFTVS